MTLGGKRSSLRLGPGLTWQILGREEKRAKTRGFLVVDRLYSAPFGLLVVKPYKTMAALPSNVHVSSHPCLKAKVSQLRSKSASAREIKCLVHEIALILGCEALAFSLQTKSSGTVSLC